MTEGMPEQKKVGLWAVIWRAGIVVAACALWLTPDSWHSQARHSAMYFALNFSITALATVGAATGAFVEILLLLGKPDLRLTWTKVRLLWLAAACVHVAALVVLAVRG